MTFMVYKQTQQYVAFLASSYSFFKVASSKYILRLRYIILRLRYITRQLFFTRKNYHQFYN